MKKYTILTLLPELFPGPLAASVIGRGIEKGLLHFEAIGIRDYAQGRHRITDDAPYGGGSGMVMKPEPLVAAIEAVRQAHASASPVILLSPQGKIFSQALAYSLAQEPGLILVCGRYEGIDERVRCYLDLEISVGDYVVSGGEIPAMLLLDAVARLIPGVLGNPESLEEESFQQHRLEYPQYTRPYQFRGQAVPDPLISGNHALIRRWRKKEALRRTLLRRPDLLHEYPPDSEEQALLREIEEE
jgi:tRNA (guanine37-N1)-methyltransferase